MNPYKEISDYLAGDFNKIITNEMTPTLNNIGMKAGIGEIAKPRYTLLLFACETGNYQVVIELLKLGVNPVTITECLDLDMYDTIVFKNHSPFSMAAKKGFVDLINLFLSYNIDINQQNNIGRTALHFACKHGHTDVVSLLINAGAEINIKDTYGQLPVHLSTAEILDLLFINGADINAQDEDGCTPLICASIDNKTNIIQKLISYGCNLNIQDNQGNTALMSACDWNNYDIVLKLISYGCDLDMQNVNCETALMIANRNGYLDIVNHLIRARCNVEPALNMSNDDDLDFIKFLGCCDS